ncbi:NAD-dependent epimerase/dehydratase family protein [Kribbella sp. NBC_01245]|uniref:NAD-dependent epimerase/dehydratase family protein n=1 Tax=Kribbella sp. NBC_01245 TaxID=2903578 RepID=UPI002E2A9150|nr:NAD-dependent epimerase/dehydratase family protein [Kribbella sp. NBC_01245]
MQVVVGAGPVGTSTARLLAEQGEEVKLVSRRGTGPDHPGITLVKADAAAGLTDVAAGASALYNCAGLPYHRWSTDWPPLNDALIRTAEATGAVLVSAGNLYAYGPVDGPITEETPERPNSVKGEVRARMWADVLAAHQAGRIRAAEVRSSDYLGAGAQSVMSVVVFPKVRAGKTASVPADLDALHSWTAVADVARTLVAVASASEDLVLGRVWHVPTPAPMSIRDLATRYAVLTNSPEPKLSRMPAPILWLGGLFNPTAKEMREIQYQLAHPFILDSTAATNTFGITPLTTDEALQL